MSILRKSNSKTSSRRQIAIKGVQDSVLMLPGNQYRVILQISSINFELKSSDEQDALIEMYQSFLNSLTSSLQIVTRVREMDIDRYLAGYEAKMRKEKEEVYKTQIKNYIDFVKGLIKTNKILSRQFFIVVPYSTKEKADFELVKEQLNLSVSLIDKGLGKLGMHTRRLENLEILELFYSFYNPHQAKRQPLTERTLEMLNEAPL